MYTAKVHILMRVWQEKNFLDKHVNYHEIELLDIFCEPELILDLPDNKRTLQDWLKEVVSEEDPDIFLHTSLEICREPILYEAIGVLRVDGWKDYWGEYYEDVTFQIIEWSCAIMSEEDH